MNTLFLNWHRSACILNILLGIVIPNCSRRKAIVLFRKTKQNNGAYLTKAKWKQNTKTKQNQNKTKQKTKQNKTKQNKKHQTCGKLWAATVLKSTFNHSCKKSFTQNQLITPCPTINQTMVTNSKCLSLECT